MIDALYWLFLVALLVDACLLTRMNGPYFTWGVPLLVKRSALRSSDETAAFLDRAAHAFDALGLANRRLSPDSMALRERDLRRVGVMHAVLRVNPKRQAFEIRGYGNTSALVLMIAITVSTMAHWDLWPVTAVCAVVVGALYAIQRRRYVSVATTLVDHGMADSSEKGPGIAVKGMRAADALVDAGILSLWAVLLWLTGGFSDRENTQNANRLALGSYFIFWGLAAIAASRFPRLCFIFRFLTLRPGALVAGIILVLIGGYQLVAAVLA